MNQIGLFDICRNYHGGNPESEAANVIAHKSSAQIRSKILEYVRACGLDGATCDQIEIALELSHQTASARCADLKRLKMIVDSGGRRETRTGSKAAVLKVVK